MGKSFADTEGRKWAIDVNVAALARVKAFAGVDLLSVVEQESKLLRDLAADPILLCNAIFAIVKPEADARGITDEAFGSALGGDALSDATDALVQAIIDFFPKARRSLLQKAFDRAKSIQARQEDRVGKRLDEILDAAEASLEKRFASSGAAPESSASIPQA